MAPADVNLKRVLRAVVVVAGLSSACAKKGSGGGVPAASASAPAVAPRSPSSGTPSLPAPAAPNGANAPVTDPMATLFGRMAVELRNRPDVHPSVDDGFAALAKAGVSVPAPQQSLGTTYKAAFCRHGVTTTKDVAVLLCEYADNARATLGLVEAKKVFPALTTRRSFARKTLVMTVSSQETPPKPATLAAEEKVIAAFEAL